MDLLLSVDVDELQLPPRAVNAFHNEGIRFVGQLVQDNPERFLRIPNFGRTSLTKTQEVLSRLDLVFGTDVRGWTIQKANLIREGHLKAVRGIVAVKLGVFERQYPTARDEVEAILAALLDGRNRDIAGKFWGLLGDKPRTLESVGQEYGMTRERVRQITTRAEDAGRAMWLPTAHCERLIKKMERVSPLGLEVAQDLLKQDLGDRTFPVESLLNVANVFDIPSELQLVKEGIATFMDVKGRSPSLHEIAVDFRRATSRSGCVNIDRTCLRLTQDLEKRDEIRQALNGLPETVWLDREHNWASLKAERNRLSNTIRKVLTVTSTVHISELRQAALRSHRLAFVPPQAVLSSFAEKICELPVIECSVHRSAKFSPAPLGEIETAFHDCFQAKGSPLRREEIESYCIDERGINDNSFYMYLSYSPIIGKIAPGIYGLVGAPVPPGMIEELATTRKKTARSEHGWDGQGRLWFATRLNRLGIKMGMFYLPAFVIDLVSGTWPVRLADGTKSGQIEANAQGIAGLRDILALSGADIEDVMLLRFDFGHNTVEVEVGDDELFDQSHELADPQKAGSFAESDFDEDE
ncbi:DNA-directed RNA polymerase subunit alpha C-terminal domain-containing protein [Allopontixanthobacter confluentis]|uniref:DNA-directed RNA polymerase subunit alpha C-terminal domain-containing protein n=1 Tax=Allopontixanthobacter confluentis TaxID=1849021 RepID=UPI00136FC675|nr:DNA-directed RNA polymerase subunit alpha C-terminal domain-containing protein [Allopontixanthobacter confluentis]